MNNNDILRRLRYAMDISDVKMVKIFELGGVTLDLDGLKNILKKEHEEGYVTVPNNELKQFLDGFIVFRRGPLETKSNSEEDVLHPKKNSNNNNIILKKLRIALNFRSEDMLKVFKAGEVEMSESELSALFRKPDHKNYRECGDKYIRTFLKGLTVINRG
ncbi:MAG: DUF1456 family protein [Fusobacteriaceae bacterium]